MIQHAFSISSTQLRNITVIVTQTLQLYPVLLTQSSKILYRLYAIPIEEWKRYITTSLWASSDLDTNSSIEKCLASDETDLDVIIGDSIIKIGDVKLSPCFNSKWPGGWCNSCGIVVQIMLPCRICWCTVHSLSSPPNHKSTHKSHDYQHKHIHRPTSMVTESYRDWLAQHKSRRCSHIAKPSDQFAYFHHVCEMGDAQYRIYVSVNHLV